MTLVKNKVNIDLERANIVDIANQIDNPWSRDTILAFVNNSKNIKLAIRLKNPDKKKIKDKFIHENETESGKRHNKKIINLIFAYLVFRILDLRRDGKEKVYVCPDHRPTKEVHSYLQKISTYCGCSNLTEEIDIDFINRNKLNIPKNTPAHSWARKVLRGKKKANLVANFEELSDMISKLL